MLVDLPRKIIARKLNIHHRMIIEIEPYAVTNVGTRVDIQMPSFELGATFGYAYAHISTDDGMIVKTERVLIPAEVYGEWGQDDKFIVDYVMQQLDLTPNIMEAVE